MTPAGNAPTPAQITPAAVMAWMDQQATWCERMDNGSGDAVMYRRAIALLAEPGAPPWPREALAQMLRTRYHGTERPSEWTAIGNEQDGWLRLADDVLTAIGSGTPDEEAFVQALGRKFYDLISLRTGPCSNHAADPCPECLEGGVESARRFLSDWPRSAAPSQEGK